MDEMIQTFFETDFAVLSDTARTLTLASAGLTGGGFLFIEQIVRSRPDIEPQVIRKSYRSLLCFGFAMMLAGFAWLNTVQDLTRLMSDYRAGQLEPGILVNRLRDFGVFYYLLVSLSGGLILIGFCVLALLLKRVAEPRAGSLMPDAGRGSGPRTG